MIIYMHRGYFYNCGNQKNHYNDTIFQKALFPIKVDHRTLGRGENLLRDRFLPSGPTCPAIALAVAEPHHLFPLSAVALAKAENLLWGHIIFPEQPQCCAYHFNTAGQALFPGTSPEQVKMGKRNQIYGLFHRFPRQSSNQSVCFQIFDDFISQQ